MQKVQPLDIQVIASSRDDVIDQEVSLQTIGNPQTERYATPHFASAGDGCPDVDGHPIFDSLAKPPRPFGRQVILDKAGSPCGG